MNTKLVTAVVVVIILLGSGLYFWNKAEAPTPAEVNDSNTNTPSTNGDATGADKDKDDVGEPTKGEAKEFIVEMTSDGFAPSSITVKKGTTIVFVNKDTQNRWPASAVHPSHQCYLGFDALRGLKPGEKFAFVANTVKSCGFHDHLLPHLRGSLNVTEE